MAHCSEAIHGTRPFAKHRARVTSENGQNRVYINPLNHSLNLIEFASLQLPTQNYLKVGLNKHFIRLIKM